MCCSIFLCIQLFCSISGLLHWCGVQTIFTQSLVFTRNFSFDIMFYIIIHCHYATFSSVVYYFCIYTLYIHNMQQSVTLKPHWKLHGKGKYRSMDITEIEIKWGYLQLMKRSPKRLHASAGQPTVYGVFTYEFFWLIIIIKEKPGKVKWQKLG